MPRVVATRPTNSRRMHLPLCPLSRSPGWLITLVWALGVLCALPFKRFRAVVPMALLTWSAGWLAALLLSFAEAGIVGLFVVK
jgi:hypothetical protein